MFTFIIIAIGAFINAAFLWLTMVIFARHESEYEWPKLVWISFATLALSVLAGYLIHEWASYLCLPFLAWALMRWCYCELKSAIKIVGIYTILLTIVPLAYSAFMEDDSDVWEIETDDGKKIKVKTNF